MKSLLKRTDLIEPELSYEIVGLVFDTFNKLGPGLKENVYQKALEQLLKQRSIEFQAQLYCPINFQDNKVGYRYLDFLINEKIIIELKCGDYFAHTHIEQVKEYLKIKNLELAILATFTSQGVRIRRIVNIQH